MAIVGRIVDIWRYPVKSMRGERRPSAVLAAAGVIGDRGWALRDERAGEIRGAKKLPALLQCAARYLAEPAATGAMPPAEVTLPDGALVRTDDRAAATRLSALVGRPITLWPLQPAALADHYRRAAPDNPDMVAELREIFGRLPDEPLPDLSVFPPELMQYTSPPGTYFDAFPLHLLSTSSLAALQARTPGARIDVRRFRPNLLIEPASAAPGFVELAWCGKILRAGTARIRVEIPCVRCVMTTLAQGELPREPAVLRTIVREAAQNVGVYASVAQPGVVAVGDPVSVE